MIEQRAKEFATRWHASIGQVRKYTGEPYINHPAAVADLVRSVPHYFGHALRDAKAMFLSKQVGKAFLGYLVAQKQRLMGDRGQMRVTRQELIDAYGFDTKYAGHVVRLAHQGIELMTTGTMSLPMRKAEREEVVAIRTGKLSFQETLTRAGELERELRDSLDTGLLPEHPNEAAIDRFVVNAYLTMWGAGRVTAEVEHGR